MAEKKETKAEVKTDPKEFVARRLAAINRLSDERKKAEANERLMRNL